MNNFIFSKKQDFLFLFFPIIFSVILVEFLNINYLKYLAIFVLFAFDYSHIFATYFRFEKNDFNYSKQIFYKKTLIIFCSVILLYFVSLKYLFIVALYYNFYHILKQNIGFIKWYQKKDDNRGNLSLYLYIAFIFFFLGMHFNPIFEINLFSESTKGNLFFYKPNEFIFQLFKEFGLVLLVVSFLFLILKTLKEKVIKISLIYFNLILFLYYYSGFMTENVFQLYIVHAINHAVTYFKAVSFMNKSIKINIYIIFFICLFGSLGMLIIEYFLLDLSTIFYIGYILPQWLHYSYDSVLWNQKYNVSWKNVINKKE